MFSGFSCVSSSIEEQLCLKEEYCLQVSEACPFLSQLNCSSFSFPSSTSPSFSSSTYNCSNEVTQQINESKEKAIAVQTCLNETKEHIECCFDPFTCDEFGECVVECPQYFYGEELEKTVRLLSFGFVFLSILVFLIAIIPLFLLSPLRIYPNYVFFLSATAFFLSFLPCIIGALVAGGMNQYLCRGEKGYWAALLNYGQSTTTLFQFSIWAFFSYSSFFYFFLFAFNLFCLAMRPHVSFFEKFVEKPVDPSIEKGSHGLGLFFSTGILIATLVFGFTSDTALFVPMPISDSPFPLDTNLKNFFRIPLLICGSLASIFIFLAIFLLMRRGRHIVYYQWRTISVSIFWIIFFCFLVVVFLEVTPNFAFLTEYLNCVSAHPRSVPSPCQREYDDGAFITFFYLFIIFIFLLLIVVSFWTNSLVIDW